MQRRRKDTIGLWHEHRKTELELMKLTPSDRQAIDGYVKNASKEETPTGLDRSIPVSHWCDCLTANESYFGKLTVSALAGKTGRDEAFTLVPTNTNGANNDCAYCGYGTVTRRLNQEDWPEPARPAGGARPIYSICVATGKKTHYETTAKAKLDKEVSVSYCLKDQKRIANGKLWRYADGGVTKYKAKSIKGREKR